MDIKCGSCYFFDQCGSDEACEHYTPYGPPDEETEEGDILCLRADSRAEYYEEWFVYTDEDEE